jgi:hypothetical protein
MEITGADFDGRSVPLFIFSGYFISVRIRRAVRDALMSPFVFLFLLVGLGPSTRP